MASNTKRLKKVTTGDVRISGGVYLISGNYIEITPHDVHTISDEQLEALFISNDVIFNDGTTDHSGQEGFDRFYGRRHADSWKVEGLQSSKSQRWQVLSTDTSASTLQLLASSEFIQVLTGSTSGQIVKMPDATTLLVGHSYQIWNISTKVVLAKNFASTVIGTLPENAVVATITLTDNSTAAGVWLLSISNIVTGIGTEATLTFTRNGGTSNNAYLYTGQTLTSFTGYILNGIGYVNKISISNSSTMASNKDATFSLRRRTGVSTFVDIPGTEITIPANAWSATVSGILIPIGPDWEVSAYRNDSLGGTFTGGAVNNTVMNVFTIPK